MPTPFTRLSRAEFLKVFKRGRRAAGPSFQFVHSPEAQGFKVAVVVSKKVAKTAVGRNALRRRTYHALRTAVEALGLQSGACIAIVLPSMPTRSYEELVVECTTVLSRAFGRPPVSR